MKKYMEMALKLAKKGSGMVSQNPMVGAVIVKGKRVVGRGWHKKYGSEHAEANAIIDAGKKARGADLYVTLEPCNHFGKQPPCTKAILKAGIGRVFAAMKDPHHVSNKGEQYLRKNGIPVHIGMCKNEAEKLNEFYITSVRYGMPFVTVKIAMTADGFITHGDGKAKRIAGKKESAFVQNLRERHDSILVGLNTIIKDNPRLTVRKNPALNPVRIVLDSEARTPLSARILRESGETIIACTHAAPRKRILALRKKGAQIVVAGKKGRVDLRQLLKKLNALGIQSVLVEPGNMTATSFLSGGLFDRIIIIVARRKIKGGLEAFRLGKKIRARVIEKRPVGNDTMIILEK